MNDGDSEKGAVYDSKVVAVPQADAVFGEQGEGDVHYTSMGW